MMERWQAGRGVPDENKTSCPLIRNAIDLMQQARPRDR